MKNGADEGANEVGQCKRWGGIGCQQHGVLYCSYSWQGMPGMVAQAHAGMVARARHETRGGEGCNTGDSASGNGPGAGGLVMTEGMLRSCLFRA